MMMDKYELQKLRDLPIEGVAERLGFQVVRHKCLCPFHDDHHASMSFKVSKNTFRCFVCGASGGPIDLVMRYLRKDFRDATKWLADENNIILQTSAILHHSRVSPIPLLSPNTGIAWVVSLRKASAMISCISWQLTCELFVIIQRTGCWKSCLDMDSPSRR